MRDRPNVIQEAIDAAGGLVILARALQLAPSTISEWRRIPAERVLALEELTGISRHAMRPDIFGELA